jgi:hypothetical protein
MKRSKVCRKALENWNKGKHAGNGICHCLDMTAEDYSVDVMQNHNWYKTIINHMGMTGYIPKWLEIQGISRLAMTQEAMREYRARWLGHLAEYYESIGD